MHDPSLTSGPVTARERVVGIDVLRGVAVLGVLIVNMQYMAMALPLTDFTGRSYGGDRWIDAAAHYFVRTFAEMKFITIFSILFGAGLAIMAERAQATGRPFAGRYARRLGVLLVIGVVHGVCIWFGDILTSYAIIGFGAMLLRKLEVRSLLFLAGVMIAFVGAVFVAMTLFTPLGALMPDQGGDPFNKTPAQIREVFSSGDFGRMLALRVTYYMYGVFMVFIWGFRLLGTFLIGIALVKSGVLLRPHENRARFARWVKIGLPVGLAVEAVGFWFVENGRGDLVAVADVIGLYIGSLCLAFAYIGLVMLWSTGSFLPGLQARVAAVGRMGLTNYLSHSVITAIVFNYLGYFDQVAKPGGLLVTATIFTLQLWWSPIWLRRFRFGPVEWLWRSLTYGRRQPMRVVGAAA